MAKGGFKIKDEYLTYGLVGVVVIGGIIYLYQNPDILNAALGRPTQERQLDAQKPPPQEDLEMEEAEQKGMFPPYGPGATPFSVGNSAPVNGSIGGPKNYGSLGVGGPGFGYGGAHGGMRCAFRPSDLVEATVQTARQYVRVLDFPVTPLTNTIPRLQSCYYREISNFVNAGPTNPVYFGVEQAACAISAGQPFPVINSKTLIAAQIAKKHINQGNCYSETMSPVPKRFDPVPVIGVRRARAYATNNYLRNKAKLYNYYARGGD